MKNKYKRTQVGLVNKIYHSQVQRSKDRKHSPPNYTFEELIVWCFTRENWLELYNNWVLSDYKIDLVPSIDRLDNKKGYSFSNIRLVTWKINQEKAYQDKLNGILASKHKVFQYDINGEFMQEFPSAPVAGRVTNTSIAGIKKCCKGISRTAGRYLWSSEKKTYDEITSNFKIAQYDLNGNYINKYITASEVMWQIGINQTLVLKVCNGEKKHAGGYVFKFL